MRLSLVAELAAAAVPHSSTEDWAPEAGAAHLTQADTLMGALPEGR